MNFCDTFTSIFTNYPSLYIYFGAIIAHIFSPYDKEFKGTKPFFITILKDKTDIFHSRLDFLVLPIIALVFGFAFIHPLTIGAAMATGLTANTSLLALIKNKTKNKK